MNNSLPDRPRLFCAATVNDSVMLAALATMGLKASPAINPNDVNLHQLATVDFDDFSLIY
jgi:hypothetical protein